MRIGLVGAGAMGRRHARALASVPDCEVTVVCDVKLASCQALALSMGVSRAVCDVNEVLSSGHVDAIIVATPEEMHFGPVMAAMAAGIPVLVEKPLTTDFAQALEIQRMARESGVSVVPGYNLRFDRRYQTFRRWLGEVPADQVISMYLRRNRPAARYVDGGVHPVFAHTSHDIDIALWCLRDRFRRVYAVDRASIPPASGAVGVWGMLESYRGSVVVVESGWTIPPNGVVRDDVFEVVTYDGTAELNLSAGTSWYWRGADAAYELAEGDGRRDDIYWNCTVEQDRAFVAAVRSGSQPPDSSLDDAVHGVQVACAMISSARIELPIEIEGTVDSCQSAS